MPAAFLARAVLGLAAAAALPSRAAAADAALLEAACAAELAPVRTLKEMVAIESASGDAEGLARMADYAERRLQALGARTARPAPVRGSAPVVQGSFEGTGTRRVLLIAHMDTVHPRGTLAAQPIRQDGNRLYGPSIADDKGGIAVILHSLDILVKQRGWRDFARLTVLLNADEEIGSPGSGELIAAEADRHDVVLSFEPTPAKAVAKAEALLLGTSGTATATLEVKGRSSHAGAAPQYGRNALVELARRILQTRDAAKGVTGAQLDWTTAQAGEVRNQIPERAVATADVRLAGFGYHARDEYVELDSIVPRLYLATRLLQSL